MLKAVSLFLLVVASCTANKQMNTLKDGTPVPQFDKQGHRGCRGLLPENTIPAMLKAIELGVTTLEMDVVFTKDKVAVVSHEPFFSRDITTTADGKYLDETAEKKSNIYQMLLAETQQYDVGLKPHPRFPLQKKIAITKPSLASLIDSVEFSLAVNNLPKVYYNIETKTNPATDGIFHPEPGEFVTLLMNVIKSKGIGNRVVIQSFDFRTLQVIHKNYPAIKTAMLIEEDDKRSLDEQLNSLGFTPAIYSPAHSLVNKALVDACHEKKIKIIPWTVNDAGTITRLKEWGVDGIITDYPNLFN